MGDLDKLDRFHAMLADYALVILSDYGKGGLTHIEAMIAAANTRGVPRVFVLGSRTPFPLRRTL